MFFCTLSAYRLCRCQISAFRCAPRITRTLSKSRTNTVHDEPHFLLTVGWAAHKIKNLSDHLGLPSAGVTLANAPSRFARSLGQANEQSFRYNTRHTPVHQYIPHSNTYINTHHRYMFVWSLWAVFSLCILFTFARPEHIFHCCSCSLSFRLLNWKTIDIFLRFTSVLSAPF